MAEPNPFEVTKAVDFTDAEIAQTFVDLPGGGFLSLADPAGPMPRFLVGGKGGGRTHLMRYSSFQLQKLRHPDLLTGIQQDGYVGIYFRCGGLNSGRFNGKGQSDEAWAGTFAYYMDVWLAQLTIQTLVELGEGQPGWGASQRVDFVESVLRLFDDPPTLAVADDPMLALQSTLFELHREMDRSINNAALRQVLDINVRTAPGKLLFGIAAAAIATFEDLREIHFVYLLDEFENFGAEQQRYVNTLIREKELPTNFIVGSRLWGLRTAETLSAGEENRQGSEFDQVVLEEAYRQDPSSYLSFCFNMVRSRIVEAGYAGPTNVQMRSFYAQPSSNDEFYFEESRSLVDSYSPADRPYFRRLRRQLLATGHTESLADQVVEVMMIPSHPILEKLAVFLFYRAWSDNPQSLADGAVRAAVLTRSLLGDRPTRGASQLLKHWKADLFAQLTDDCGAPQTYLGMNRFVEMSGFLPRNLLIILKQVTRWSIFLGESPFDSGRGISVEAQINGVRDASGWFLVDSKALGDIGEESQVAVRRLGSFLRRLRFSNKPVEVSCCTFSTDRLGLTERALATLDACVQHSLLLEVRDGQRHRNSGVLHHKYQLNPMLAPTFDLPTARRGVTPFSAAEMVAVFDARVSDQESNAVLARRLAGMNAPFSRAGSAQGTLYESTDGPYEG